VVTDFTIVSGYFSRNGKEKLHKASVISNVVLLSAGLWHTNISRDHRRLIAELKTAQVSVISHTHTHTRENDTDGQKEQAECVLCLPEILNSVCVPRHDETTLNFTHRIFREEHRDPITSLQVRVHT